MFPCMMGSKSLSKAIGGLYAHFGHLVTYPRILACRMCIKIHWHKCSTTHSCNTSSAYMFALHSLRYVNVQTEFNHLSMVRLCHTTGLSDVAMGYFGRYSLSDVDGHKLDVLTIKVSNTATLMLPTFQTVDGERITEVRTKSIDASTQTNKARRSKLCQVNKYRQVGCGSRSRLDSSNNKWGREFSIAQRNVQR